MKVFHNPGNLYGGYLSLYNTASESIGQGLARVPPFHAKSPILENNYVIGMGWSGQDTVS